MTTTSTDKVSSRPGTAAEPVRLFYADGYHGGIKGHMPIGAWRDVLQALRRVPEWKISLDIEPISWQYVRQRDPAAFREIRRHLRDRSPEARVEMVAASYAQPFCWVIGGESNVRHLTRGLQVLRKYFPGLVVDTYAVQEPCWTSCLPQILRSLGFQRAVLKDPSTAWSGYTVGMDASVVNWVGPDGTGIPAVPRYACEDLVNCWETESCYGTLEFARKCRAHGITHPAGMYYQDCGWAAKPRASGEHIRYVTWREYFSRIAPPPEKDWRLTQEDIRGTLPWGDRVLQRLARQVRSAENRILVAEKLAAMASVLRGARFPRAQLERAWDNLLMAQHHDAWVCCMMREERENWAWQVGAQTWQTEEICASVVADACRSLARDGRARRRPAPREQWVRVFNSTAADRRDLAEIALTTEPGTRSVAIHELEGHSLPVQVIPTRKYGDGTLNAARVVFPAGVPAMGYSTYRLTPTTEETGTEGTPSSEKAEKPPLRTEGEILMAAMRGGARIEPAAPRSKNDSLPSARATRLDDQSVLIETDLYRIVLDGSRGGTIASLYAKHLRKEFRDARAERLFNEYGGYFFEEKQWRSSADQAAELTIIENGPVRVRVLAHGRLGSHPFWSSLSVGLGQRRIDFHVRFQFAGEVWIGKPIDRKDGEGPAARVRNRQQPFHDDRWKLQAFFPATLRRPILFKNAAYDVARSRNEDSFYSSWDQIKHNIILNWVDLVDAKSKHGLALFSDHTTSYAHGKHDPLALILAWAGEWWTARPLKGRQEARYALVPHAGAWDEAGLSEECARWCEPLVAQLFDGPPAPGRERYSLVRTSSPGIEIPTLLVDGQDLLVRLFNAEGSDGPHTISLACRAARAELAELDGRRSRALSLRKERNGRCGVRLSIPRFGLRTVRFCDVRRSR